MNPVDVSFALILLFAMLRGYSRGLLGTAAGYVAPVLAFMMAADWSDPVRERIAGLMPAAPDLVLDIVAPLVVFVVVVASVRIAAAFFASLLGVGLSMPSRILASVAGVLASGLVLGSLVLLVREMRPNHPRLTDDDAGDVLASPLENVVIDLDRRFTESRLAPPLAEFAAAVVSEAMAHRPDSPLLQREDVESAARKAAEAAAAAVGKPPAAESPRQRDQAPSAPRGGGSGK